ncbi:diphosphomevalonate decarboxylase [Pelomyxa schiedti]|nr:diphosphomevalonate decarboxylase [Pelomyxa schiedti]
MADDGSGCASVTCRAAPNIAVVKYWGKRDEALILPLAGSLSVTMDHGGGRLATTTTVRASPRFEEDTLAINGRPAAIDGRGRACLQALRLRATVPNLANWKFHIESVNDFPTAAGLASSASGFACLVFAVATLLGVEGELSTLARIGSGSACRSIYGGFVEWEPGVLPSGEDSIAQPVFTDHHWNELNMVIVVVNDKEKEVGSTSGMQLSVKTSALLKARIATISAKIQEMKECIASHNFETFAQITMQESNQLHAICMDTFPPLFYLNDISKRIIHLVTKMNEWAHHNIAAYTFDAGPNAVIFTLEADLPILTGALVHYFSQSTAAEVTRSLPCTPQVPSLSLQLVVNMSTSEQAIISLIHSKVGPGPVVLSRTP